MNTHIFDNHYVTCPVCHKNATPKLVETSIGLFSCPYCQERLVVCQSGHYVRDPFTAKQIMISSTLRRQSRPLARIVRDFILLKRPIVVLAVVIGIFLSAITLTQPTTSSDELTEPKTEQEK
jgi:uncharacterized protein YbaR (Trm112 family)